jgi:hypothetical protein
MSFPQSSPQVMKAREESSFSPAPAHLTQRRCACGGTPGPDGECAACKARRLAGNADARSAEPRRRPSIALRRFEAAPASAAAGDKSEEEGEGAMQDQSASVTAYTFIRNGVRMEVEAPNVYSSPTYPDGFKWTQTITTNAPLGGATSPYVDPHPNDDAKPFYWTDAEQIAHPTTFIDHPQRPAPPTGMTDWDAVLCLNGVDESTKNVTAFDCIGYGFSRGPGGAVTQHGGKSVSSGGHRSVLASEFGDWTFKGR